MKQLLKKIYLHIFSQNGFTLVEVMLAGFISAVVIIGAALFFVYFLKNNSFSFEENQEISLSQYGMTILVKEIREARSGDDGAWPLLQTDDNQLILFSDVTNDGRTDKVRYFLDGTDLKRGVIEPTAVPVTYPSQNEQINIIASHVDNAGQSIFTYYNGNWPSDTINNPLSLTNRLLNTRYIKIYLRINITPDAYANPFELTSGVQIRSLKNNL